MKFNEYQQLARRSAHQDLTHTEMLSMLALGVGGEAGEVVDETKKIVFHGHTLNKEHLAKELGDLLWYIAVYADEIGVDLERIAEMNIAKLRARYPTGFNQERSINRFENLDQFNAHIERNDAHLDTINRQALELENGDL